MKKKTWELSAYGPDEMIKPNELVQIKGSGPLTLQDRRVFNILLNNAWGTSIINPGEVFTIGRDSSFKFFCNSRLSLFGISRK